MSLLGSFFNVLLTPYQKSHEKKMQKYQHENAMELQDDAQAFAREQYDYEFAKEAEYNSPQEQRKRLEDAGFNPYMMLDGGSAGSVEASTSAPTGSPGGYQVTDQANKFNTSIMRDLLGFENLDIQKQIADAEVRSKNAITRNQEIKNAFEGLKQVQEYEARSLANAKTEAEKDEIRQRVYEMRESWNIRLSNLIKEGAVSDSVVQRNNSESDANEQKANLYKYQAEAERLKLPYIPKKLASEIADNYASAYHHRQQGHLANALAETERKTRKSKVRTALFESVKSEAEATIAKIKAGTDGNLTPEQVNFIRQLHITELEKNVEYLTSLAEQKDKEAFWAGYNKFMDGIGSLVGAVFLGRAAGKAIRPSKPIPTNQPQSGTPPQPYN